MLSSLKNLETYSVNATDGNVVHVKDFYFEDDTWTVRYLEVVTGSWLSSRQVLISPISLQQPDWVERTMPVWIAKEQVKNCPDTDTDTDTDKPVSRQNDAQHHGHYGHPVDWEGASFWGDVMFPNYTVVASDCYGTDQPERGRQQAAYLRGEHERHRNDDPHLRSCNAVTGHHIHAIDGGMGQVSDFLMDDEIWSVPYLVIDISNGWVGHSVSVNLSRESIKTSPTFDSAVDWDRDNEMRLYRHHCRYADWAGGRYLASGI